MRGARVSKWIHNDAAHEIARALGDAHLDGWLFYELPLSDPLAYRILGLSEDGIATRRWFCYVPAHGTPQAIVSAVGRIARRARRRKDRLSIAH